MSAPRHGEGADSSNTSSLTASLSSRFQGFLSRNQGKIDNVTSKLDTLSKSVYGYFTQSAPTDSNVPTSVLEALSPDALGFNYVTRNVIIMPFPDQSLIDIQGKSYKRVSLLSQYLSYHHPGKYLVFNISESTYDYSLFSDQVVEFFFPGYPAPPLHRLFAIVKSINGWLAADQTNIAVVQCQTGVGRSAVVVAAYLAWCGLQGCDAMKCLEMVAMSKQVPALNLLIPTQRRYLSYVTSLLSGRFPSLSPIVLDSIRVYNLPNMEPKGCRPYVQIFKEGQLLLTSTGERGSKAVRFYRHIDDNKSPSISPKEGNGTMNSSSSQPNTTEHTGTTEKGDNGGALQTTPLTTEPAVFEIGIPIEGDILIRGRHLSSANERVSLFRCGLYAGYLSTGVVRLSRSELDGGNDDRLSDTFAVEFVLKPTETTTGEAKTTTDPQAYWSHLINTRQHEKNKEQLKSKDTQAMSMNGYAGSKEKSGGGNGGSDGMGMKGGNAGGREKGKFRFKLKADPVSSEPANTQPTDPPKTSSEKTTVKTTEKATEVPSVKVLDTPVLATAIATSASVAGSGSTKGLPTMTGPSPTSNPTTSGIEVKAQGPEKGDIALKPDQGRKIEGGSMEVLNKEVRKEGEDEFKVGVVQFHMADDEEDDDNDDELVILDDNHGNAPSSSSSSSSSITSTPAASSHADTSISITSTSLAQSTPTSSVTTTDSKSTPTAFTIPGPPSPPPTPPARPAVPPSSSDSTSSSSSSSLSPLLSSSASSSSVANDDNPFSSLEAAILGDSRTTSAAPSSAAPPSSNSTTTSDSTSKNQEEESGDLLSELGKELGIDFDDKDISTLGNSVDPSSSASGTDSSASNVFDDSVIDALLHEIDADDGSSAERAKSPELDLP